ncbi:hypothetical protein [Neoactinobaculum massilliense]|uniref:hypothetical protein n=1 Tax=Neoactinobaculum massilliense TaxID=2364794 RepID=UPI0019D020C8|nr:hypothetical protein [Neoactinobaculum massilliense]
MGKWFKQAHEIEYLRAENKKLAAQVTSLQHRLRMQQNGTETAEVSDEERKIIASGRKIDAIKAYRERTGASLYDAKMAIDEASYDL